MVVTGVRDALPIGTTRGDWTTLYGCWCAAGILIEREHLPIERNFLRCCGIDNVALCVHQSKWQLLQNVLFKGRTGNDRRGNDGQGNPHPLAVEEEEQFV